MTDQCEWWLWKVGSWALVTLVLTILFVPLAVVGALVTAAAFCMFLLHLNRASPFVNETYLWVGVWASLVLAAEALAVIVAVLVLR